MPPPALRQTREADFIMPDIKPIETEYHGYRMRSRLEARWAIFFDAVGIAWDYELDGYPIPAGNYLPDFWLSTVSMWAEVKPKQFTKQERAKASQLATSTGYPVLMLIGTPDVKAYPACMPDGGQEVDFYLMNWHGEGRLYASYGDDDTPGDSVVTQAVNTARGARFEHGEQP
jgi:hypothetical protein